MNRLIVIRIWFLRLITWDGLLPITVWIMPALIHWLLPNNRGVIEVIALVFPIVAFFTRYRFGRRHILSNHCSPWTQRFQLAVFCFGILVLALIDAVMILVHVMPQGMPFASPKDRIIWCILYAVYFTAMAIAMFPGFSKPRDPMNGTVRLESDLDRL